MANFMNSIKMLLEGKTEQTSVDKAHYCATHVEHLTYGKGTCISEQHAEPDLNGNIEWYTVQFDGQSPMKIMTSEMKILQAEAHMHSKKKMKEEAEQIDEKLVGNQHKIDANKNNRIDAHDFELLRNKKKQNNEEVEEVQEAKTLIGTHNNSEKGHTAKVYKLSGMDNEGDDYHVKLFKGGKHYEPADYFTDDKDDAHNTAKKMVKEGFAIDEAELKPGESAPGIKGKFPSKDDKKEEPSKFEKTKTAKGTKYSRKLANEEIEQDDSELIETVIKHNDFVVELPEELTYKDYLSAVRTIVDTEDPELQGQIIAVAAEAYDCQEYELIIEARTKEFAQKTVSDLRKSGKKVSGPEMVTHQGKPGYQYTVTDGDKQTVTIHTAQGVVRKVK